MISHFDSIFKELSDLQSRLDSALIAFNSVEDVRTVLKIRKTIRYIQNAFAGEIPLAYTLARLNRVLPASSIN